MQKVRFRPMPETEASILVRSAVARVPAGRSGTPGVGAPERLAGPALRRLRVLTLTDIVSDQGGAERLAVTLARDLDTSRFERYLCTTRPFHESWVADDLERAGVTVLRLDRRGRIAPGALLRLARFLRSEGIDVVHAHKLGSSTWASLLAPLAGVPVVVAHEHGSAFTSRVERVLHRHVVGRRASAVVAVSSADARSLTGINRVPAGRIRVIPNGITPRLAVSGHGVREELAIAAGVPVVATLAVLRPEKALDVLVQAAAILRARHPQLRVLVAGEGPDRSRLERLIANQGIESVVTLLGQRSDVFAVLDAADVTVCCSDREGSPLSVIEYMASGSAIVATRVGGIPDLIEDGAHGLLVEPRDPTALAASIDRLLGDPGLRDRLGASAHERQSRELGAEQMIRRFEDLYLELFAASGRG